VSIYVSMGGSFRRRFVISCDAAGCPVQVEPAAAEAWRSDVDARSWAREQAVGWTAGPDGRSDYCPAHASNAAPGSVTPRPTSTARGPTGEPLDRDEYATLLRDVLAEVQPTPGDPVMLTAAHASVAAHLLAELAGVFRGEDLGALAQEVSALLGPAATSRSASRLPPPASAPVRDSRDARYS
jgi:hypothetical protein